MSWLRVRHASGIHVTRPLLLGDAVDANDLSDLFATGAIPRDNDNKKSF